MKSRRGPATDRLIWELAGFLGKRDWSVGEASPPPAICLASREALGSTVTMVFIDGTARGGADFEGLLGHWQHGIEEQLRQQGKVWLADAPYHYVALTFCDLPEPLATQALSEKKLALFAARHAFCRVVDFDECTVREHSGIPYFTGHGTADIQEFLDRWRIEREEE